MAVAGDYCFQVETLGRNDLERLCHRFRDVQTFTRRVGRWFMGSDSAEPEEYRLI